MKKIIYTLLMSIILSSSAFAISGEQIVLGDNLYGTDVAIYGDWAVVGIEMAPVSLAGVTYPELGMISIYKKNPAGNWEHKQSIQETTYTFADGFYGTQVSMHYGHSVDIYNDLIIVGAPDFDSDRNTNIGPDGMGFIYQLNPANELWEKVAELKPAIPIDVYNNAGRSVSISENWAVIGDDLDRHPTSSSGGEDATGVGSVAIYHRVGNSWEYHTELQASDAFGTVDEGLNDLYGDRFGYSVDVYGDMIAVGASEWGVETGGWNTYTGKVYIYEWDGANWNETGITSPTPEIRSEFATSVSLYNGQLVVGAPYSNLGAGPDVQQGAIYYFNNYSGNWSAGTKVTASDAQNAAHFGNAVDINNNQIGVGASGYDGAEDSEGRAYIFDISNSFNEDDNFIGSDSDYGDNFGYAVALSNEDILVSAIYTEHNNANGNQGNDGTAYFYSRLSAFGGSWIGTVSIDWENPANWADNNVPNAITDVNIPTVAPFMPSTDHGNAICRSMTIEAGASYTNAEGGQLLVNGNLVCHGNIINTESYKLKVDGTSLFDGAGVQDMPAGTFHELTYDAGANSIFQGDVEVIGDYYHDSNKNLSVLDNIFIIHGRIIGDNELYLKFNETSDLFITGSLRNIDLYLPEFIRDLNNFTLNLTGHNDQVNLQSDLEIHGTLNLFEGKLVLGEISAGGFSSITLNRPISITNGHLIFANEPVGDYGMIINNYNPVYGDFIIPAEVDEIQYIWSDYTGVTRMMGDINIINYISLSSSSFETNGFTLSFDANADIYLYNSASLTDFVLNAGQLHNLNIADGTPTIKMSGEITNRLSVYSEAEGLIIASGSDVKVSGETILHHPVTLKSDANGRANFIDNGISYPAKDNALFNVEQYIDSKDKWHYISTPVQNSTANFFAGAYLNYYDTDIPDWVAFTSLDQAVNTMQGYSTKLPNSYSGQTITFSGELNTAKDSPLSISLSNGGNKFNLVGNPFPSTIDWDNANWTKTNIANAIYLWDPANGRYASYVGGVGVNGGTKYIAANQAFFVEANGANPSLQIDNNDVRVNQAQSFYKDDEVIELLSVSLLSENNIDEIIIRFNENATESFDADFDANKMFGDVSLAQVYAIDKDEEKMSIHSLKSVKETDFVNLGLQIQSSGTYTLQFDDKNSLSEFVSIKIEDTKEGTITELSLQDTYSFNYEEGENAQRFILHFKDATAVNNPEQAEQFAYYSNGSLYISNNETNSFTSIQIINMAGQIIKVEPLGHQSLEKVELADVTRGMYLVQLISDNNARVQKIMIK